MSSRNVGWHDAGIRGLLGGMLLLLSAFVQHRPFASLSIGFIGIIFVGTALFRVCPLYTLFRIKSC